MADSSGYSDPNMVAEPHVAPCLGSKEQAVDPTTAGGDQPAAAPAMPAEAVPSIFEMTSGNSGVTNVSSISHANELTSPFDTPPGNRQQLPHP